MAKGAAWMVGARIGLRFIGLISTIILARVLVPEDFGLVAVAMLIYSLVEFLGEFGFDVALIAFQRSDRKYYDTAWSLSIIRSLAVAVILLAVASPTSVLFEDERLVLIIACLSLVSVVTGFENIGIVDFRMKLQLRREFVFLICTKCISFTVTIAIALLLKNYWALVIGIFSERAARVVFSYVFHPFRPRWSLSEWRPLVNFSKWLLIKNIFEFHNNRIDSAIIGKISGSQSLGLYTVAYEIANLPTTQLAWPIARAIYPGYAMIAHDRERLVESYINVLSILLLFSLPAGVGISLTAELIVNVVLGPKWVDAIPLLEILAIYGVFRVGAVCSGDLLIAMGRPRMRAFIELANALILLPMLIIGVQQAGAYGVAWAMTSVAAVVFILSNGVALYLLSVPLMKVVRQVWRTGAALVAMIAVVFGFQAAWPEPSAFVFLVLELVGACLVGAILYAAVHLALWYVCGRPAGAESYIVAGAQSQIRRLNLGRPGAGEPT